MQRICRPSASSRRWAPTARAVCPPIPASTSSNTSSEPSPSPPIAPAFAAAPCRRALAATVAAAGRRPTVRGAQQRQHHPRELAARRDLPQRAERQTRVGSDQELDSVTATRAITTMRSASATSNRASAIANSDSRSSTASARQRRSRASRLASCAADPSPAAAAQPPAPPSAIRRSRLRPGAPPVARGTPRHARSPLRYRHRACAPTA